MEGSLLDARNFILLLIRIVFPLVNAVAFFGLFAVKKKRIYLCLFILFLCSFFDTVFNLSHYFFPDIVFNRSPRQYVPFIQAFLREACTFTRIYCYYRFGNLLFGRKENAKTIAVCILFASAIMLSPLLRGENLDYIRYYGVLFTYTAVVWSVLISGLVRIVRNRDKFNKFYCTSLILLYLFTLLCYIASFALTIFENLAFTDPGNFTKLATMIFCFAGAGWIIIELRSGKAFTAVTVSPAPPSPQPEKEQPQSDPIELIRRRYQLTDRELEILVLMLEGKTNEEIAQILWVAVGTVKSHIHNIFGKMGITRRSQLFGIPDINLIIVKRQIGKEVPSQIASQPVR